MKSTELNTLEASALYMAILDYFIMCDDPKYSTLHKFRKKILTISHYTDRMELVKYFESETGQNIGYFTLPY